MISQFISAENLLQKKINILFLPFCMRKVSANSCVISSLTVLFLGKDYTV